MCKKDFVKRFYEANDKHKRISFYISYMKKICLFLLALLSWQTQSQDVLVQISPLSTQSCVAQTFYGRDSYGAIYSGENQTFTKQLDKQIWEYKNPALGTISNVILTNPLKIVLFYEQFNTVILVDNQLNELEKISLSELSTPIMASAIGLAEGNRLWIYNSLTNQLGLLNLKNKEYKVVSTPFTESMAYYQSDFNTFQWIDQAHNWYSCSIYGKIALLGSAPDFDRIQIDRTQGLVYCVNQELIYYSRIDERKTPLNVDKKSCLDFRFKDQILSIFTNPEISNYKIIAP
ncbi:MAG: hypothetical protein RLZ77_1708 [Bacteroidota bacterium]